jgi:hypothetical protein
MLAVDDLGKRHRVRTMGDLLLSGMPLRRCNQMDDLLLYRLCDEAVAQGGASRDDRDRYIYREGFYRGMGFSLLMLLCHTRSSSRAKEMPGSRRSRNSLAA